MTRPLPLNMRLRIVEAYERKEGTYFELAQRFGASEATVYRLLRLKRERGFVISGPPSGIHDHELPQLVHLVRELPEATVEELKEAWVFRHRCPLSRSSMTRALRRAGIARSRALVRRARPGRAGRRGAA